MLDKQILAVASSKSKARVLSLENGKELLKFPDDLVIENLSIS